MAQDPAAVGRAAAEQILARLGGDRSRAVTRTVPVTLIERGSGELRPPGHWPDPRQPPHGQGVRHTDSRSRGSRRLPPVHRTADRPAPSRPVGHLWESAAPHDAMGL
ncbi:hypothetical protein ACWDX6_04970 [Streptomyces sp. NPDC003027]